MVRAAFTAVFATSMGIVTTATAIIAAIADLDAGLIATGLRNCHT